MKTSIFSTFPGRVEQLSPRDQEARFPVASRRDRPQQTGRFAKGKKSTLRDKRSGNSRQY